MATKMQLPRNVREILNRLSGAGYEAYAVGGCIRDLLLGRTPMDWDITTSAKPEEVKRLFPRTVDTGIQHGTVTVLLAPADEARDQGGRVRPSGGEASGGEGVQPDGEARAQSGDDIPTGRSKHRGRSAPPCAYEVTTYRIDGDYEDCRHPSGVTFTGELAEDLRRRDFTINAMAYNDERGLIDLFDGIGDLRRGVIRCVGDPGERFSEDALRMLRAVRFAAQLNFAVEEGTAGAIRALAPNIGKVSAERIRTELVKLLVSDHPEELRQVYRLGLSGVFLPELDRMMETPQNTPHHSYSVGEHMIRSVQNIRPDRVLRLTMLLHDVAKPECRSTDEDGRDHFHGHPQRGAVMAEDILRRLRFDNNTIERVRRLVLWHDDRPRLDEGSIRRAVSRIGADLYPDLFEVKRADALAQSDYLRREKLDAIDCYEALYRKIVEEKQCLTRKELAVGGRDLIGLGMKPGKELGGMLERLFDHVLDHPKDNERDILLELARRTLP